MVEQQTWDVWNAEDYAMNSANSAYLGRTRAQAQVVWNQNVSGVGLRRRSSHNGNSPLLIPRLRSGHWQLRRHDLFGAMQFSSGGQSESFFSENGSMHFVKEIVIRSIENHFAEAKGIIH